MSDLFKSSITCSTDLSLLTISNTYIPVLLNFFLIFTPALSSNAFISDSVISFLNFTKTRFGEYFSVTFISLSHSLDSPFGSELLSCLPPLICSFTLPSYACNFEVNIEDNTKKNITQHKTNHQIRNSLCKSFEKWINILINISYKL